MLDLHYLALVQAKSFLLPGGAVLSTLGARVPLEVLLSLAKLAGYSPSLLTYTWKVQAVPDEVIPDHAQKQKEGFGPFHFYLAETLEKAFASVDPASPNRCHGKSSVLCKRFAWMRPPQTRHCNAAPASGTQSRFPPIRVAMMTLEVLSLITAIRGTFAERSPSDDRVGREIRKVLAGWRSFLRRRGGFSMRQPCGDAAHRGGGCAREMSLPPDCWTGLPP